MQKGSQGRRHLSLSVEQAGEGPRYQPEAWRSRTRPWAVRPQRGLYKFSEGTWIFSSKRRGERLKAFPQQAAWRTLFGGKLTLPEVKGGLRSLDTCGPEEGPWELARERGEAAAIGQRKQESLPSLRTQRCKHSRREGVQDNTHVWGLGNEAEVRGFDYRIAVFCHLGNISNAREGGNVFFICLH